MGVFLFTISLFKLLFLPEDFNNPQLEKKIKNSKSFKYFFKKFFKKKSTKKGKANKFYLSTNIFIKFIIISI